MTKARKQQHKFSPLRQTFSFPVIHMDGNIISFCRRWCLIMVGSMDIKAECLGDEQGAAEG